MKKLFAYQVRHHGFSLKSCPRQYTFYLSSKKLFNENSNYKYYANKYNNNLF